MSEPANNGNAAASVVYQLRELVAQRQAALVEHDRTRAQIVTELRQYEKALASLIDPPRKPGPKPDGERVRAKPSKIAPDKLDAIRDAVVAYAQDHEEFRQVDVRATVPESLAKSSTMATAFEMLRQENLIRFARRQGISKFYRLTASAAREIA